MKKMIRGNKGLLKVVIIAVSLLGSGGVFGQRNMEYLNRGLVAVAVQDGVFLSWRIFALDTGTVGFNLYRNDTLVNPEPITGISNYVDPEGSSGSIYTLETKTDTVAEVYGPVSVWGQNYLQIPLQTPSGYTPNDASVADLDGDGELEIIVKMEGSTRDNSQSGYTDPVFLHAYKMNGTLLWSIDLGINIRGGAHYTQFMVYDLDSDGRAEVACKTAPGTTDGSGSFLSLGPAAGDNDAADYRNSNGYILSGPEYLTVFDGLTGTELSTVGYIPLRGDPYPLSTWGDTYGNRVDRFLACVAYFDTIPSLVMCRGYYDRTALTAWDFVDKQLVKRWAFDTQDDQTNLRQYEGQGSHGISVGDVDKDGKDEIMYGAMAFDDDGTPLYNTRFGHGDASHMSDLIPSRPGLEFFMPHESAGSVVSNNITIPGISVRDAATGEIIWSKASTGDIGRGLTADISAAHPGNEFWAASGLGVYNSQGEQISTSIPSINFAVWWDGDLLRELLDGIGISKWGAGNLLTAQGCSSNNGTKSTPALSGDILGDWREEVIWRTSDNRALRIYTTTIPTQYGIYTLLQDPQYRLALTWQNVAYNQPPHPGFFLGHDMEDPPVPDIRVLEKDTSPILHFVAPRNGSEVNLGRDLQVVLQATSLSDTNQTVVIYDHDTIVLDSIPGPPYATTISGLASGEHTLTATAWDMSGNPLLSEQITFTVDEGYPHITLSSPQDRAIILPGEAILLAADAYDTDGSIDSVSFFINGMKYVTLTQEPFSTQMEEPEKGDYTIMAVAYDNTQKETPSGEVSVEAGAIRIYQENAFGFCGFENGTGSIDTNHEDFTGSGFANSENITGVRIIYGIRIMEEGDYRVTFRYAAEDARPGVLYVNDTLIGAVDFGNTGSWDVWQEASLDVPGMSMGINKVTIEASVGNGLPNIDWMKLNNLNGTILSTTAGCSSLPTGVEEQTFSGKPAHGFDLFPVPASRSLSIRLNDRSEEIRNLTIFSTDGRMIRSMDHLMSNQVGIDLTGMNRGIYLIRIATSKETYTARFTVIGD
jgi:rhamnogalacturonan endolyase